MTKREKEKQKRKNEKIAEKKYRQAFTNGNALRYMRMIMTVPLSTDTLHSSMIHGT